jgi:glutathione S-transferase
MEPILVYGFPLGSSMGLVAACEWLGQPYRLSRVDMLADMTSDAYGQLNGRRETPVLITDDVRAITETMAIARWLLARDVERRISFDDAAETDRMHQLMGFINTGFTGAFSPLWSALEMKQADPAYRETLRDYGRRTVAKRHAQLEAMIGNTPFLVGQRPSLADALLIGVARWADYHNAATDRSRSGRPLRTGDRGRRKTQRLGRPARPRRAGRRDRAVCDATSGVADGRACSRRRHLVELRRGRVEMIPGVAAHMVCHHLRLVAAGFVESRGVNGEEVGHRRERQMDGRAAGRTEAARLHVFSARIKASSLPTTTFQPSLIPLNAESFLDTTKPEWTRRTRVPLPTRDSVHVTTVSSGAP